MPRTRPAEFEAGDTRRDVHSRLALQADRLQRVGIVRATDQEIAADRCRPTRWRRRRLVPANSPYRSLLPGALTAQAIGSAR